MDTQLRGVASESFCAGWHEQVQCCTTRCCGCRVGPANELLARQGSDALSIPGAGRKICSSVMLQQLLFYNIYCSLAWLVFVFVRALQKVRRVPDGGVQRQLLRCSACLPVHNTSAIHHWPRLRGDLSTPPTRLPALPHPLQYSSGLSIQDPDVVRTVLVCFWLVAEPLRLLVGYYGNLQENVGGCWGALKS